MGSQLYLKLPSGQKLPALGLGTWEAISDEEIETAVNNALDLDYRHIDTAWVYENEAAIGKVLKKRFASGLKRQDVFITTKLPMTGVHPDRVDMFIKKSLTNLQLDYVDLYLIHFPVGCTYYEGEARPRFNDKGEIETEGKTDHVALWKKMEEQVDAGRAKNIGLSNYNISQIETVLKNAKIKPAALQVELHVYLQQRELVEFCQKNGIAVIAYSPLGNPGMNKFLQKMGQQPRQLANILEDAKISEIAKKHKKTPAQVALRFLIQRGIAVIPKSVTPKRIDENRKLFDFVLSDDEMKTLYGLNVGEAARVCDFKVFGGLDKHPDFPFAQK
ncbi:Alcohol dehydrogenase [NADP(+)] A-like Protein [Tribolium castaneum]|uniref:Alcohol dehydrogenase [NADP(+)] A-like Protein n=2 Tax=Tribolium castaneum TaxID=7070 RepID=D6X0G9_TRICA|nr:Alcohol dehydrogenase [NADP(+)] A-like Protein [Tribolium castaneum]